MRPEKVACLLNRSVVTGKEAWRPRATRRPSICVNVACRACSKADQTSIDTAIYLSDLVTPCFGPVPMNS